MDIFYEKKCMRRFETEAVFEYKMENLIEKKNEF